MPKTGIAGTRHGGRTLSHFRTIEKRRTDLLLPVELDDRLRAVRGRRSISWVVSAALCQYWGLDPADFGLDAPRAARETLAIGAPLEAEN